MKRWMWLTLAAVVVVGAGVTLVALPSGQEWTTDSPEALVEFQAAMDAEMKLYYVEAREHFRLAYELDPDFQFAKLKYSSQVRWEDKDEDRAKQMVEEVLASDTSKLTPRERFFVEQRRAYHEERPDDVIAIVDEYVARYPNDPYILNQKALRTWHLGELEEAERLYQRLVEISPNWVIAYNQLGYITMMQGRFAEAEEYFKSYRFIAPDQANPYDSLGELFMTLGRYDEAEESLEKALEIKPDFWASYEHLVLMKAFSGDLEGTRVVIERARNADGPEKILFGMDCLEHYTALRNAEAWQQIIDEADSKCVEGFKEGFSTVSTHFAACKLGDWEKAMSMEVEAANLLEKIEKSSAEKDVMTVRGAFLHMQGVRLALQGEYAEAEKMLRAADEGLTYVDAGTGMYKLFNRMILAEVLLADGQDAEAHGLLTKVRGVNPVMVAEFEQSGLKTIGLDRG
ncbi:MAG: tetratricopeptide repeat protein [Acidobacteria bacterium]|nr:tetratricopeptide repeat protein [Candidatus Sulfomarinibacter sp. MAG AM1]